MTYPEPVVQVLEDFLTRRKINHRVFENKIFNAFKLIVGEHVAAHVHPIKLYQKELTVAVDSASWRQQLQLLAMDLKQKLCAHLGHDYVQSFRFIHGNIRPDDLNIKTDKDPQAPQFKDNSQEERARADMCSRAIQDNEIATLFAHLYLTAHRRIHLKNKK